MKIRTREAPAPVACPPTKTELDEFRLAIRMIIGRWRLDILAADRTSCSSPLANQVRLVLHTAAYWLLHGVRAAAPKDSPLARAELGTLRLKLIKIAARVVEGARRILVHLPSSCPEEHLFRRLAGAPMPGAP